MADKNNKLLPDLIRTLVDGATDPSVLLDTGDSIIAHNSAFMEITGARRKALSQAMNSSESGRLFIAGMFINFDFDRELQSAKESRKPRRVDEVSLENLAGEQRRVIIFLNPVIIADEHLATLVSLRDVSAESSLHERYKDLLHKEKSRGDELEVRVAERTRELSAALSDLTHLSRTDPLTGLANRRAISEYAERALEISKRHDREFAVIMCDLDHFKKINDNYGHDVGDKVLVRVAKVFKDLVRTADLVGRFGGEEFILVLTEVDAAYVGEIAQRAIDAVGAIPLSDFVPGAVNRLSTSAGVAIYPMHASSFEEIVKASDRALYTAKNRGRGQMVIYSDGLQMVSSEGHAENLRVVIVSSDQDERNRLSDLLPSKCQRKLVSSIEDAQKELAGSEVDALVIDNETLGVGPGDFLSNCIFHYPNVLRLVIVESEWEFIESSADSRAYADQYLLKQEAVEHLGRAIEDGLMAKAASNPLTSPHTKIMLGGARHVETLDSIIESRALEIVHQPIVDRDGKIVGHEMLSRVEVEVFRNPEFLFSSAALLGRTWQLGRLVRMQVAKKLSRHPEGGLVFVNLHPNELYDPQLATFCEELKMPANNIVFEITESGAIPDLGRFQIRVRELHDLGYRFAIDDLGSGYAGLSAVCLLEPDYIKLDRMLVAGLAKNAYIYSLLSRIVEFANENGALVIAEGIETEQEAKTTRELGCHLFQGFFFGRPLPD